MTSIVSNGLSFLACTVGQLLPRTAPASAAATTGATSQPAEPPFLNSLLAVGVCILIVYIIRRILAPRKLRLDRTPGRPNRVTGVWAMGLFSLMILQQAGAGALMGIWFREANDPKHLDPMGLIYATIVSQIAFLPAVIWAAAMTFPLGLSRGLGLSGRHWFYDSLRGVIAFLAVLPVCLGLLAIMTRLIYGNAPPPHPLLEALRNVGMGGDLLAIFSVCVLAPLAEEIFFRGIVQSMLRRYLGRPWQAVLVTSVFFGMMHLSVSYDVVLPLIVLGVVLGYNYERTGRLWTPILIHMLFNIVGVTQTLLVQH